MQPLNVLLSFLLVCGAYSCSLPPGTKYYGPIERTILAPLVIHGRVLNITTPTRVNVQYKACVRLLRILKGTQRLPREFCFGWFGPDYLCLVDVFREKEYVFFMNADRTARYDGFPQSAIIASSRSLTMVNRGHCDPRVERPGACERVRIDLSKFRRVVRVLEGETAIISCPSRGTRPVIINWSKRGHQGGLFNSESHLSSVYLRSASISDTGTYICRLYNPAGETSERVRVFVEAKPCGNFLLLRRDESKTIATPNYPRYYPRDKMCTWRICPATRQKLELSFKVFDLRWDDSLLIYNECDLDGSRSRTYCTSTSPGLIVSNCASYCIQMGFSAAQKANFEARGFEVTVTSTDKDSTVFDYANLYCQNHILVRFQPKTIYVSEIKGRVLHNYKRGSPRAGEYITLSHSIPVPGLFGCSVDIRYHLEYYIGATLTNGRYRLRFAMLIDAAEKPVNFENHLNNYKNVVPVCSHPPTATGGPTPPSPTLIRP